MTEKQKKKGVFKRFGGYLRTADRITMLFMAVVMCIGLFTMTAAGADGDGGSTEVNTNIGGIDMTISRFSELIAGTFSDNVAQSINHKGATMLFMQSVDKDDTSGSQIKKNQLSLGTVGNVLGYAGKRTDTSNASNIWTDGSDASSKMMTLQTIWDLHAGERDYDDPLLQEELKYSPIAQYIVWGSALNYMGVDEFRDAKAAPDGLRMISGYAAYIFFILAYSANGIMVKVVEILRKMNVFMWIWEGLTGTVETFATELLEVDNIREIVLIDEIFRALEEFMSLRWVILALMVILFVASITVWKSRGYNQAAMAQTRGRKIVYRLIIMCIGIPICGMIYTECLVLTENFLGRTENDITKYVFQEFMDFEAWTTGITLENGSLRSFKAGSSAADSYCKLTVAYESAGQRFHITTGADGKGESIDVNRFVYSVNEAVYGTNVTGRSESVAYISSLFEAPKDDDTGPSGGTGTSETVNSYIDIVNSTEPDGAKRDTTAARAKAYKSCRDLLLNYARSNTVSADVLNNYYVADMNRVASALIYVDGSGEETAANEAAAANATVLEQLFGANAAEQRIWSFVELEDEWIYPAIDSAKDLTLLDSEVNGHSEKIGVSMRGLSAASSVKNMNSEDANGVYITRNGGGSKVIMCGVLGNSKEGVADSFYVDATGSFIWCNANKANVEVVNENAGSSESTTAGENGSVNNYIYTYQYDLSRGGLSPLSVYNYMHSKFENGTLTVYSPKLTTNAGVGMMHYSVTTPYSGIPELVQLLLTIAILFSLGIIGWVFGVSLLVNSIVQMCKALPVMFKMMMGSIQGFAEGLLIVFSVILEMLVTIALYCLSVYIIDFLIRLIRGLCVQILSIFGSEVTAGGTTSMEYIDPETYAIVAGLLSTAVILWGTFNLLKWRVAITISLKSVVTKMTNAFLGTNAAMPTGADSNMLKAAAGLAAGGMIAGALAEDGTLDDVVNDLTQSDLGTSLHDKISEGDWDGAMQDIQDFANGDYVSGDGDIDRGENVESMAEEMFGKGANGLNDPFGMQSLTDEQQAELDDKYKDDALAAAQKLDEARKSEDPDAIKDAQSEFDDIMQARASDAAKMRAENGEKARELGVPDYGDYLRAQKADAEAQGLKPIEGADIPDEPEKELTSDGQMAYEAARDGDAETLRSAAGIYDANGLTEEQREELNDMIADGATEGQIADRVEEMAEENFGENHAAVVDKMNEAAGRSGGALYGSSDNSDGKARTVAVASGHAEDGSRAYGVRDNNSDEGVKTFNTGADGELTQQFADDLPEDPGQRLSRENQAVYDAAVANDQDALASAAQDLDENGLTAAQASHIDQMVDSGKSASDIAAQVDEYASANLGDNHKAVMDRVNAAAGRGGSATYGSGMDAGDRSVTIRAKNGDMEGQGSDWGITDSASAVAGEQAGESTFQTDGRGNAIELPSAISDVPSKDLSAGNQAIFEAARDGNTAALQQAAHSVNAHGLTADQSSAVQSMISTGASEAEVAAAIDNFAQDNFGNDYKQVVDSINDAAGRDGTVTYSAPTGGGEDGMQPRSMEVGSGFVNGQAAYSVDDLSTDGPGHMVTVSDENGQSVYQDTTPGAGGEQVVTSDFGQFDGQTYGSIRNEVDAVANASGGMLQRGSGAGDFGKTTVSEAASEIASRQSQAVSGGRASAKVGSSVMGAGTGDLNAFNAASREAVKTTGLEAGDVAGIAGGVDSHGMATTTLPAAGDLAGPSGPMQTDLRGNPVVNADAGGGAAQLIAASSVDSYGRGQAAMAQNLGVEMAAPGMSPDNGGNAGIGGVQADPATGVPGGMPTNHIGGMDTGANSVPASTDIPTASNIPAVTSSQHSSGVAPSYYDAAGNPVTMSTANDGTKSFTDAAGKPVDASSVYASGALSDLGSGGPMLYSSSDAALLSTMNGDGTVTMTDPSGFKVPVGSVISAAQDNGVTFHNASGETLTPVANANGSLGFTNAKGEAVNADQVFASAPANYPAALDAAGSGESIQAASNIPAMAGTPAPVEQGPAFYDGSGQAVMQTGSGGFQTASGQPVDPSSVYSSAPVVGAGSGQGAQMFTANDVPVQAVANGDGTVTMQTASGSTVPAGEVIQAAQGDGISFHDAQGNGVQAVGNANGTMSFVSSSGAKLAPDQVFASAPVDHGAAQNAVQMAANAVNPSVPATHAGEIQATPSGGVVPESIPMAATDSGVSVSGGVSAGTIETGGGFMPNGKFTKADIPMALGLAAAATTFVKTGNLGSAAMAYSGTQNAATDVMNRVSGTPESSQGGSTVQTTQGGGTVAAPAGGTVQTTQNGTVQSSAAHNMPGSTAVNTAAVQSPSGGSMMVARGGDGVIRTVDTNGNITGQAVAMTSDGQYQTITKAPDGSYRTSGTGQQAVQTTDGSYVTVTQNDKGQMTVANAEGGSSGTVLTRTSRGYTPAVPGKGGAMYTLNDAGQPTGSVSVPEAGRNGGSVSVVRHTDGSVRLANPDGSASSTVMAATSDGGYAPMDQSGGGVVIGGRRFSTVTDSSGVQVGVHRASNGTAYAINNQGAVSPHVMAQLSDGSYVQEGAAGAATLPNGASVRVVQMTDNGGSKAVVQAGDGSWRVADANGQPSSTTVYQTTSGAWASSPSGGAGSTTVHETVNNTTYETTQEQPGAGAGPTDYMSWFKPFQFGYNGGMPQQIPGMQQVPGVPPVPGMMDFNIMMQQQMAQFMPSAQPQQPGQNGQTVQPVTYTPETLVSDQGQSSEGSVEWDSGGTYNGSDDRG